MAVDVDALLQVANELDELIPLKVAADDDSPTGHALPVLDATARDTLAAVLVALLEQLAPKLAAIVENTGGGTGVWAYQAGANGLVEMEGDRKVLAITAIALGAQGSFTINAGDPILMPYDSTDKTSSSITLKIDPRAQLVDPTIDFDANVDAYVIEFVV